MITIWLIFFDPEDTVDVDDEDDEEDEELLVVLVVVLVVVRLSVVVIEVILVDVVLVESVREMSVDADVEKLVVEEEDWLGVLSLTECDDVSPPFCRITPGTT